MTTDEYVPGEAIPVLTDEQVREHWVKSAARSVPRTRGTIEATYDSWLAAHDARVRREAKAEALRDAAENVDAGALADAWTRGAVTRLSVTNAVAEVLMSLRSRAAEYETGDSDE